MIEKSVTQFEWMIAKLNLQPHQYVQSRELRDWALRSKRNCYVPEELLAAWKAQVKEEEAESAAQRRSRARYGTAYTGRSGPPIP